MFGRIMFSQILMAPAKPLDRLAPQSTKLYSMLRRLLYRCIAT